MTLPVLVPAIAAGALLAVLYALSDFGAVSLLQFDSLSRAIYLQLGASFDRSLAAILALVLVVMTVAVTWGEARLRATRRDASGRVAPAAARRRGPSRPLALAGRSPSWAPSSALALVVPVGTIAWWLVRGLAQGEPLRLVVDVAARPFVVGAVAAVVGGPAGRARRPAGGTLSGRVSAPVRRRSAVFAGYALPGIVVALAMVFLATRTLPMLYQTLALLVARLRRPLHAPGRRGLRAALAAAGSRLEEAGRTLGDGPTRAFAAADRAVPASRARGRGARWSS